MMRYTGPIAAALHMSMELDANFILLTSVQVSSHAEATECAPEILFITTDISIVTTVTMIITTASVMMDTMEPHANLLMVAQVVLAKAVVPVLVTIQHSRVLACPDCMENSVNRINLSQQLFLQRLH